MPVLVLFLAAGGWRESQVSAKVGVSKGLVCYRCTDGSGVQVRQRKWERWA